MTIQFGESVTIAGLTLTAVSASLVVLAMARSRGVKGTVTNEKLTKTASPQPPR
jgi:hypothetical protein